MAGLEKQADRFGTEILFEDVTAVDLTGHIKKVTIGTGETFLARSVIISTGSAYRELGLEDEKRLSGPRRELAAQPATASSSRARTWQSSAAATRRWKKHCS